jgi:hypothetical protein
MEMVELETRQHSQYVSERLAELATATRDREPARPAKVAPVGRTAASPPETDGTDWQGTGLESLVRRQLDVHPYFRGRGSLFAITQVGRTVVIEGRVPSYYLKQLMQEAIKAVPGVTNVDNQVQVTWPRS